MKQETGSEFNSQYGGNLNQYQNNGAPDILPGLGRPIKTNPASPPQIMTTSPALPANMATDSCMMSSQQQTMHSPGYMNAAGHSPQHQTGYVQATSPHNVTSPHMNTDSPQLVGQPGVDTFQVSQARYQPSKGTGANTSEASFPVTEMSGVNQAQPMLTQPVQQVEHVSSLEMDADLIQTLIKELDQGSCYVQEVNPSNFNFGGNVVSQTSDFSGFGGAYNSYTHPYYFQNRGANACGLQSRNATGGMLEQMEESGLGLDVFDGQGPVGKAGFDEVDAAVFDRFDLKETSKAVSPLSGKVKSDHSYAKTVPVVPCPETDRQFTKIQQTEKQTEKQVIQEETNKQITQVEGVNDSEGHITSTVTMETQQELKSKPGTYVQTSVKPVTANLSGKSSQL